MSFFLPDGALTAVEDISLVSEAIFLLWEDEGKGLPSDKEKFSETPFPLPTDDDPFSTVTSSEDKIMHCNQFMPWKHIYHLGHNN